jgi:hypothetical protein
MRHIVCGLTPLLVLVSISAMARAEPIVGIGNGDIAPPGILYSVDPISGAIALLGPAGTSAGFYPVSPSPVVGGYFALSPVNHYLVTYPQAGAFDSPGFALWDSGSLALGDYAYDSSNGKLFALRLGLQNAPPAAGLVLLTDTGTSFPNRPNSHSLTATLLASAPVFPGLSRSVAHRVYSGFRSIRYRRTCRLFDRRDDGGRNPVALTGVHWAHHYWVSIRSR